MSLCFVPSRPDKAELGNAVRADTEPVASEEDEQDEAIFDAEGPARAGEDAEA